MTNATHTAARGALRRLVALAMLAACATLFVPSPAAAYQWPLKPFAKQHPVRGFFGDPRIGDGRRHDHSLHLGIDISAANGTPVYATLSGQVVVEREHPHSVAVKAGSVVHSYWHLVPAVRNGDNAVAGRTVLGRVQAPWAHVHFGELRNGLYLNPLRRGGLSPYADRTRPVVEAISFERRGARAGAVLHGRVDLVAQVADAHPLLVPDRWRGKPVMPAVVRWRVVGSGYRGAWRTAIDFTKPLTPGRFSAVFAPWTRQNKPWRHGRYGVLLARNWGASQLAPGGYSLEVVAADTRGNSVSRTARFTVAG